MTGIAVFLFKSKEKLTDVPAYAYLHDQMRNFQVTGEKICRAQQEVEYVAQTYLCYLESSRKQEVCDFHHCWVWQSW